VVSRWTKCIAAQGGIRGVALQATDLVREVSLLHGLKGQPAQHLGEAVMGAILIASYCKAGERINLNIQSTGTVRQALVDAHPDGTVRGYVIPSESLPEDGGERGPWGEGLLSVLRTKGAEKEQPYIGTVPLVTGHLAKDLTFYWMQSEQIPSAVGLAVLTSPSGDIEAAGGFLVQILPGAAPAEVRAIEQHIQEIQSLATEVARKQEPVYLLSQIFQSTAFVLVEEKPLELRCTCSWERVRRALTLVGAAELRAMLSEDREASVRCDFCTKEYKVDAAGLEKLIQNAEDVGPVSG
jgi:molecular chaperone Hsp33